MSVWDEHKHKRFHGKFTAMGMNVKSLRDEHNVKLGSPGQRGVGAVGVVHGKEHIGVVHKHKDGGFKAFISKPGANTQALSDRPFQSRAEAAAAIAAEHPSVKSLSNNSVMGSHGPPSESVQARARGLGKPMAAARAADLAERKRKAARRKVPKHLSPDHPSLQPGYGRGLRNH